MRTSSTLLTRSGKDFKETGMTKNIPILPKPFFTAQRAGGERGGTRRALSPFTARRTPPTRAGPPRPAAVPPSTGLASGHPHGRRVTANHNDGLIYSTVAPEDRGTLRGPRTHAGRAGPG
ncbi:unnamed protein product [Arctogadus glacialis]